MNFENLLVVIFPYESFLCTSENSRPANTLESRKGPRYNTVLHFFRPLPALARFTPLQLIHLCLARYTGQNVVLPLALSFALCLALICIKFYF